MLERLPTQIKGMDKLIDGGLPKGAIILVSGTPGTGKSIFCAQIAYNNALKGKKCLYLNLEQNEGRLEYQMEQFGWTLKKAKNLRVKSIDSSDPKMIENLLSELKPETYDLIVLDSLDSISSNSVTPEELHAPTMETIQEFTIPTVLDTQTIGRIKLKKIFSAIAKTKATALLTSEKVEGAQGISRDTISEFLCDGIILLHHLTSGGAAGRTIIVEKMRGTKIDDTIHPLEIGKKGIVIGEQKELYQ